MDEGARWATAHGVAKSRTRLSNITFTFKHHIAGSQAPGCVNSPGSLSDHAMAGAELRLCFVSAFPPQSSLQG